MYMYNMYRNQKYDIYKDQYANSNFNEYNMSYYNPYHLNFNRNDEMYFTPNYIRDYGPEPFAININEITENNDTFRTALWTGRNLQLTVMSIPEGEDIGAEIHPNFDQFIYIVEGKALAQMGDRKDFYDFQRNVSENYGIIIPAAKWHNVINMSNTPLKVFSIYAPPAHPKGTIHFTKADEED